VSEPKKKRVGLLVAILVTALHVVAVLVYLAMTRRDPDPRLVGSWYGFHQEAGYTYDYLDHRAADGTYRIQVRLFPDDWVPGAPPPPNVPPGSVAPEPVLGSTFGRWHSDGIGFTTTDEGSDPILGTLSLGEKVQWWIRHREWPEDEIAYDYRLIRIAGDSVAYENPQTARKFWNVRVPPGSSFPERPLPEDAAREEFRIRLEEKSHP
jgi:hypothetical protein